MLWKLCTSSVLLAVWFTASPYCLTLAAADIAQNIVVTEGTNIAPTVSPDGKTIVMDLQNRLWSLPSTGGTAKPITDPLLEPSRPDWSPTGDFVAFQCYSGGTFHIWTAKPDGAALRQLTGGHGDDREPRVSPDGAKIAFSSDRAFNGTYDIWVVDVASGQLAQRTSTVAESGAGDEFEPAWSPDGLQIAFVSGAGSAGTKIEVMDAAGARRAVVEAPAGTRFNSPSFSPDGARIAYLQIADNKSQLMVSPARAEAGNAGGTQIGTSNDVFPFSPTWLSNDEILCAADGKILVTSTKDGGTRAIPFKAELTLTKPSYRRKRFDFDSTGKQQVKGIVGPALSPDGKRVLFQSLNQIWVMEIGKQPVQLTHDSYYKEDPAWSPDGKRIAYSSDRAGQEDIYIRDLATGAEKRATSLPDIAAVACAWSPDGAKLAFQNQDGATYTLDIATGAVQQVIAPLFAPSKPNWSADGRTIAVSALKPYTRRFREGTNQILTVDVATGHLNYTEPAPFKSLSTRGEDGPIYSPDGSAMAFVMDSLLWIAPVGGDGLPTGPAKQINDEVTDAPSWSGDSQQLLYLSNGQLRLVSRDGGIPHTVPLDLSWRRDHAAGKTVIHAARLWDGRGPKVVANVDITVVGNRIQRIEPHRNRSGAARYVDASHLTVLPGLWESHTHQWISGKFYGDRLGRLWLAYGVTALQSVGDPVYRAAETREAFASGERVGPRYFATGEAIDGERIYYNFMRPTASDEQLQRELSRAAAMDYDMLKTYVRLPHAMQLKAMHFAHDEMGVWAGSHYMLPCMAFGMDAMTHVSATSKTGFAYTRSLAGISYQDVREVFGLPGRFCISTPFNSSLYGEDRGMVDDKRLQTLNTPWEQQRLKAKRDAAVNADQAVSLDRLRNEEDTVRAIRQGGGIMLAGTDSPLDNVATALHLNIRAQAKYGLAPWEALQSVTSHPAKALGVDNDLGTVEPGKLADLTFVSGDPLSDIKDLANVQMVMKDGRLYTVEDLMAPFAQSATTATATSLQGVRPNRVLSPVSTPDVETYWWHDPLEWNDDDCGKQH